MNDHGMEMIMQSLPVVKLSHNNNSILPYYNLYINIILEYCNSVLRGCAIGKDYYICSQTTNVLTTASFLLLSLSPAPGGESPAQFSQSINRFANYEYGQLIVANRYICCSNISMTLQISELALNLIYVQR